MSGPVKQRMKHKINLVCGWLIITVYQETLTKGNFGEFDESSSNRQSKTNQYKATMLYFILIYCISIV